MDSFVRYDINRLAVTLNDIYNEQAGGTSEWDDLSDHLKRSNIAAADHMIVKIRYLLDDSSITKLTEQNCRSLQCRYYLIKTFLLQQSGKEQRAV